MTISIRAIRVYAKMALQHGAQLVPVITFGENDLYNKISEVDLTFIRRILFKYLKVPKFYGRGVFGLWPLQKPLTTVVGEPICIDQVGEPSNTDVDKIFSRYCSAIQKLYGDQNHFNGYSDVQLIFKS